MTPRPRGIKVPNLLLLKSCESIKKKKEKNQSYFKDLFLFFSQIPQKERFDYFRIKLLFFLITPYPDTNFGCFLLLAYCFLISVAKCQLETIYGEKDGFWLIASGGSAYSPFAPCTQWSTTTSEMVETILPSLVDRR